MLTCCPSMTPGQARAAETWTWLLWFPEGTTEEVSRTEGTYHEACYSLLQQKGKALGMMSWAERPLCDMWDSEVEEAFVDILELYLLQRSWEVTLIYTQMAAP